MYSQALQHPEELAMQFLEHCSCPSLAQGRSVETLLIIGGATRESLAEQLGWTGHPWTDWWVDWIVCALSRLSFDVEWRQSRATVLRSLSLSRLLGTMLSPNVQYWYGRNLCRWLALVVIITGSQCYPPPKVFPWLQYLTEEGIEPKPEWNH